MIRTLAIGISAVIHPLLVTVYLFTLLFFFAPTVVQPLPTGAARQVLLALGITTFVLPALSIGALRLGILPTAGLSGMFNLATRQERVRPFLFVGLFYLITTYLFAVKLQVNLVLVVILATATALVLALSVTSLFTKVSAHATGSGALVGFLVGLGLRYPEVSFLIPVLAAMLLAGAVMSARLYLDLHPAAGVWRGAGLGFGVSLLSMLWLGG
ncbi:MAG: PA-phosphatase [Tunicatimonas sp.]